MAYTGPTNQYVSPILTNDYVNQTTEPGQIYPMYTSEYIPPPSPTSDYLYTNPIEQQYTNPVEQQYQIPSDEQLEQIRMAEFKNICDRHEINPLFASKMRVLAGFKIVIVCDDSGSMNEVANSGMADVNPYGSKPTRWDELKVTVCTIIDIVSVLNDSGIDIHFLNREGLMNVTNRCQIERFFCDKPRGYTPIVQTLKKIFNNKIDSKRLVLLATDGIPTDVFGITNIPALRSALVYDRTQRDYVTILACTDDENTMSYLNNWDTTIPRLDVIDDYNNEKKEILKVQGKHFKFSYGDFIVKCLLGSIDPWFDSLDEIRVGSSSGKSHTGCKCVLL